MLERIAAPWVVVLLGAHVGAGAAFAVAALDGDEGHHAIWWWVVAVVLAQATAAVAGLLRVRRHAAATAALGGAFAAAALPAAARPSPVPEGGWLLVLHVLPYAVIGAVLAGSAIAQRRRGVSGPAIRSGG